MKILFMGTPDYAAVTLDRLIKAGHNICGVFAQPDKPFGRKRVLTPPPVKQLAQENGISVYQPESFKDGSAFEIIKELAPELIVVVAYGKILPREVLDFPRLGCINAHASLLPKYRGAAPIQWAIINGEEKTGVTIQYMDSGIDTGDIIEAVETKIGADETAEELFERLSLISADLTLKVIDDITEGKASRTPQNHKEATHVAIIKKEMAQIDFSKTASEVHNAVRGFYSWPCAFFFLNGKRIKVTKAKVYGSTNEKSGTVIDNTDKFIIACGNGTAIEIVSVIPEGAKPMSAASMLKGNSVPIGTVIGE
ncbi:MAG: methionyl-tRNA formyltransferase [Clostridia bacterium]|nr:methionyl-tRNA formyltransferase [Clostridia bacterium]